MDRPLRVNSVARIGELTTIDAKIRTAEKQLRQLVTEHGSTLTSLGPRECGKHPAQRGLRDGIRESRPDLFVGHRGQRMAEFAYPGGPEHRG